MFSDFKVSLAAFSDDGYASSGEHIGLPIHKIDSWNGCYHWCCR